MSEPTRLMLAQMRAAGTMPRPTTSVALQGLRSAAERAGRRLVEIDQSGQEPLLALGWQEGNEPVAGLDTGVERAAPSPVLILTFAAALRACWPDPIDHPFPGVPTSEDAILAAIATLGPLTTAADAAESIGSEAHRKGALRRLRDAGFLAGEEQAARLGPVVASWSQTQVRLLRGIYEHLPHPVISAGRRPLDDKDRSGATDGHMERP